MSNVREEQKTVLQSRMTDPRRSALVRYREAVVGDAGLARWVAFELVVLIACGLPGALGFAARKVLYPMVLGSVGRGGAAFGRNLALRHPHKVRIGTGCIFDDNVVLDAKGATNRGIDVGNYVMVGRNTVVGCKEGDIRIGDRTNVGINCVIHSESSVEIGSNVLISSFCYVLGGGRHDFDRVDVPIIQQGSTTRGVRIEDNCWIGAGVTIMDGVTIGHDAVIGAGAVVTQDVAPYAIAVGLPARFLRSRLPSEAEAITLPPG